MDSCVSFKAVNKNHGAEEERLKSEDFGGLRESGRKGEW